MVQTDEKSEEMIRYFERTTYIVNAQAEGLAHADSLLQPQPRGNCFNWVLGHIVDNRDRALVMFGETAVLSTEEATLYCRGSKPITDGDTAVPLVRLLTDFNDQHGRIIAALGQIGDSRFAEVINAEKGSTFGDRLAFLHWHETYHVGQLELLRQLAGTDDAIIK